MLSDSLNGFYKTQSVKDGSWAYAQTLMSTEEDVVEVCLLQQSLVLAADSRGILSPNWIARALRTHYVPDITFCEYWAVRSWTSLVSAKAHDAIQGDEIEQPAQSPLVLDYDFLGNRGFSSVETFDAFGIVWQRHFWSESDKPATMLRVTWGGARLFDRYREAIWTGTIDIVGSAAIAKIKPFGGLEDNPGDQSVQKNDRTVTFKSRTSGDVDGVNIFLADPLVRSINHSIRDNRRIRRSRQCTSQKPSKSTTIHSKS